ncbi:unnamed protein product [Sphagnum balticum]
MEATLGRFRIIPHRQSDEKDDPLTPRPTSASIDMKKPYLPEVTPTLDSIQNPSITAPLQTLNAYPKGFDKASMTVLRNDIPGDYLPGCIINLEFSFVDTAQIKKIYRTCLRDGRLWIEENYRESSTKNESSSERSFERSSDRAYMGANFILIPHQSGRIAIQAPNKQYLRCMCPNRLENTPRSYYSYGMTLHDTSSPKDYHSCLFSLKLVTQTYGNCAYKTFDEEETEQRSDSLKISETISIHIDESQRSQNDDSTETTRLRIVDDYNPLLKERSRYFIDDTNASKNVLSVLVPTFTESDRELRRTLEDLEVMETELRQYRPPEEGQWEFNILIICDGWFKASRSMRKYIQEVMCLKETQIYELLSWAIDSDTTSTTQTMIIQRTRQVGGKEELVPLEFGSRHLKISVLVKRDNRRKHNSHEWFLYAFAPVYSRSEFLDAKTSTMKKFVFLTDCGTRFHPACVSALMGYMLVSSSCVAASGRQRVMSRTMQESATATANLSLGIKDSIDELFEDPIAFIYRVSQCFDYEASISSFNGAFSLSGMLPVIPGPCGLFRLDLLLDESGSTFRNSRVQHETLLQIQGLFHKIRVRLTEIERQLQTKIYTYIKDEPNRVHKDINNRCGYVDDDSASKYHELILQKVQSATQSTFINIFEKIATAHDILRRITLSMQVDTRHSGNLLSDEIITQCENMARGIFEYSKRVPELSNISGSYDLQTASWEALWKELPNSSQYRKIRKQIEERDQSIVHVLTSLRTNIDERAGFIDNLIGSQLRANAIGNQLFNEINAEDSTVRGSRDPFDLYFQSVNKNPEETGLLEGSLLLAEDRILSYAMPMKSKRPDAYTTFVPNAIFYFEAETDSEPLIAQRRRWTNGTVAGYMWLLKHRKLFASTWTNTFRLSLLSLRYRHRHDPELMSLKGGAGLNVIEGYSGSQCH